MAWGLVSYTTTTTPFPLGGDGLVLYLIARSKCLFPLGMKFKYLKLSLIFGTGATVEPYGSFVSNLFTRWGDLDISIELSNGSHISSVGKKQKQVLLGDILKALRMKGKFLYTSSFCHLVQKHLNC